MTVDKEHLHVQYFYNSVIEFIYFVIIYIESYGFICLSTLAKHVKFFKVEVEDLLSSFAGNTSEEKLCSMLTAVDCFIISENKIKPGKTLHLKNFIFEDLILSKTVDLALNGLTNVKEICKNLNLNNVISIDESNLLNILKKSSHFSIESNFSASLLHYHGILGFEGYSCNLIVSYFHNILQHSQKLSYTEIEHHRKFISFCGIYGVLPVLCILYCNDNFRCDNEQVMLNHKSNKSQKQKSLHIKIQENNLKEIPIEKLMYHAYGLYLHKWTGEICNLTENFGIIYCVTDFADNYQGVFRVYFNKSVLKFISEIGSLKDHLQIRDIVKFDAKYCQNKNCEYWKATKIEIPNYSNFAYNESFFEKLKQNSELQRRYCTDNMSCLTDFNDSYRKCNHVSSSNGFISTQMNMKESMLEDAFLKKCKISNNVTKYLNDKSYVIQKAVENNSTLPNQKLSNSFTESLSKFNFHKKGIINDAESLNGKSNVTKVVNNSAESQNDFNVLISNFIMPDYLFVFGHVFILMADKGIAISKQGNKLLNFCFLKDAVYPPNNSQKILAKDQKILALIPYIEETDVVPVASFVYGLSKNEETASYHQNPKEFMKKFIPSIFKDLAQNFNDNCCNVLNSLLTVQPEHSVSYLPKPAQLQELYELIINQCNISVCKVSRINFWKRMIRACSKRISNEGTISYIIKLSKILRNKFALKSEIRAKHRRKKRFQSMSLVSSSLEDNEFLTTEIPKEYLLPDKVTVKSKSLNFSKSSLSSLSSYKTCLTNSTDTLYSCESDPSSFATKDTVKENCSQKSLSDEPKSTDSSKDSLSSSSSNKSCVSTDTIFFCNNDPHSTNKADKLDSDKNMLFVSDEEQVISCPTVLNSKISLVVENIEEEMKNIIIRDKKFKKAKYFGLKSFTSLKHISSKKGKQFRLPAAPRSACTSCYKSSQKVTASISLITHTFFFYSVSVNGYSVALPLPKKIIPEQLQSRLKINSPCEVVIIPDTPINFSHILSLHLIC